MKGQPTLRTRVGFVSRVNSHVDSKTGLLKKCHWAVFALELALQCMAPNMRREFFVDCECGLALSTLETGCHVDQITMLSLHMLLGLLGLSEGCVTNGAQIRLLSRMLSHVCVQASFQPEGHAALLAGERAILSIPCCVDLAVALQLVSFFERGTAMLAFIFHACSVLRFPTTLLSFIGVRLVRGCDISEVKVILISEGLDDLKETKYRLTA